MRKISNKDTQKLENLYKLNKIDELEKETKKLLNIEKNNLILLNILGVVYIKKEIFEEAENIFKKILNINSKNTNAIKNLGEIYRKKNKIDEAIKYYELYLESNLNDIEILNNLASCYLKSKRYDLAVRYYKNIVKKKPDNEQYLTSLAFSLIESLNFNEGIKILEKILDNNIRNKRAYNGYLFFQNYNPSINFKKINEYINKFNNIYKKNISSDVNFYYKKNPSKINLAFISPDFRNHPVSYALVNVIKNLKKYNFNLFGYYNFNINDNLTRELKNSFDYFYNIFNLSEKEIVDKIRSDQIHILIDLAGHSVNNNLTIFYHKPAPIQISWLGYLPTTGIKEIQYKIGDPYIYPKALEKNYTEKFLNLPRIWSDFELRKIDNKKLPDIKCADKSIIFASFVTLQKINEEVIKLWSKVLNKFMNTKIHFKAPELHDLSIQKMLISKFAAHGIGSKRLILEKSSDYTSYIQAYSKVHITLDPFPWNGVTTSFESIWMGVPVFCLEGNTPYSRCTYSINKNLKMEDWIAKDENDYLLKLGKIISDKNKLFSTKKNLRKKFFIIKVWNSDSSYNDLSYINHKVLDYKSKNIIYNKFFN